MSENVPPPPGPGDPVPPPPPPPPPGGYGAPPPPPPPPPGGGWGTPPPPPGGGYAAPPGAGGYSIGNAYSYAWDKFKANALPLILVTLAVLVAVFVVQLLGNLISAAVQPDAELNLQTGELETNSGFFGIAMIVSLLFTALSIALSLIIQSGIIKGSLDLTRGQNLDVGGAFSGINWGQVVLTALITAAATFVGLVLCILPGLVVIFLTSYALYFVIDRDMGAVDAIKASINLVTKNIGTLLLFWLSTLAVTIVGACLCGVGLLVAYPLVILAQAYTFRMLTGDTVTA